MADVLKIVIEADDQASGPLGGVSNSLSGLDAVAGGILKAGAITMIGKAIVDGAMMGFEAAASYEQLSLSLQAMTAQSLTSTGGVNSMAEAMAQAKPIAEGMLDSVQKMAIQSPFSQEGIALGLKSAMTFGFNSDQALKLTQTLTDFAAGTGQTDAAIGSIATALGKVHTTGKFTMESIQTLATNGVPAMQMLADHFGVTTAEMAKMITKGAVPAEEAIWAISDAMDAGFKGAGERAANSLQGLTSTLGDLAQVGLRNLMMPALVALEPLMAEFADWFTSDAMPVIAEWGKSLGEGAESAVQFGRSLIQAAADSPVLQSIMSSISDAMPEVTAAFGRLGTTVMDAFTQMGPAMSDIFGSLGATFASLVPMIADGLAAAIDIVSNTFTALTPMLAGFADGLAMAMPYIGAGVQLGTSLLTGALQALSGDWSGAQQTLVSGADAVVQAFGGDSWQQVTDTWGSNFNNLSLIVSTFAANAGPIIGSWIAGAGEAMGSWIAGLPGMVAGGFNAAVAAIAGAIGAAAAAASMVGSSAVSAISGAIMAVPGIAAAAFSSAVTAIRSFIGAATAAGAAIAGGIVSGVQSIIGGVVAAAAAAASAAVNTVKSILGIASPSKVFHSIGEFMMQGLADGVFAETKSAVGQTQEAMTAILNAANVSGDAIDTGALLMEAINAGIVTSGGVAMDELQALVANALKEAGATTASGMSAVSESGQTVTDNPFVAVSKYLDTLLSSGGDFLNDWSQHVSADMFNDLTSLGELIAANADSIDMGSVQAYLNAVMTSGDLMNDWLGNISADIAPALLQIANDLMTATNMTGPSEVAKSFLDAAGVTTAGGSAGNTGGGGGNNIVTVTNLYNGPTFAGENSVPTHVATTNLQKQIYAI